jgi:hypothetical protein
MKTWGFRGNPRNQVILLSMLAALEEPCFKNRLLPALMALRLNITVPVLADLSSFLPGGMGQPDIWPAGSQTPPSGSCLELRPVATFPALTMG